LVAFWPWTLSVCSNANRIQAFLLECDSPSLPSDAKCAGTLDGGATAENNGHPAHLVSAMNSNALPFFLLANLMTGAVNLAIDTTAASTHAAHAVLIAYAALLCAVAIVAQRAGLRLRF
jgi:hypothetical protein